MSFIVSYGVGSIIGFLIVLTLLFWLIRDIVQKKHSVLRNYPLIGRLRYFLESQGEYIRQYFIAGERDEMPFNRASRSWICRTAKGVGGVIGFGSTNDLREPGSIIFVNAPFPILECDQVASPAVTLGEGYCREAYTARSLVNISCMSFGALSSPAIKALS
ncbi:MAG: hypothetical protein WC236_14105 [Gallionellaceae bacterium]|jgi:glutamate synthase domain-containing protein 2